MTGLPPPSRACQGHVNCKLAFILTQDQVFSVLKRAQKYSVEKSPIRFGEQGMRPQEPFVWRAIGTGEMELSELHLIMDEGMVGRFIFDAPVKTGDRTTVKIHIEVWQAAKDGHVPVLIDTREHQRAYAIFRAQLLGIPAQIQIRIDVDGLVPPPEPQDPPEPPRPHT